MRHAAKSWRPRYVQPVKPPKQTPSAPCYACFDSHQRMRGPLGSPTRPPWGPRCGGAPPPYPPPPPWGAYGSSFPVHGEFADMELCCLPPPLRSSGYGSRPPCCGAGRSYGFRMLDEAELVESPDGVPCDGLFDRPDPHNLALSLSCAEVPDPALAGGEGSACGRPPSVL